jgi:hypothetical protein
MALPSEADMKFTEFYPTKPGPKNKDSKPYVHKEPVSKPERELKPYRVVVPKA